MKQMNEKKQDKGLRMAGMLGGLPDDLVLSGKPETDPHAGEEKKENWFLRMMSSPVAAVALSLCVAVGVLFLIVRAGQGAGGRQPAGQSQGNGTAVSVSDSRLLPDGNITGITLSSLPEGYYRRLDDPADVRKVLDCLLDLKVAKTNYQSQSAGMTYVMTFSYDDGSEVVIYEFDRVLHVGGGGRFIISVPSETMLCRLLWSYMNNESPDTDVRTPGDRLLPDGELSVVALYTPMDAVVGQRDVTDAAEMDDLRSFLNRMTVTPADDDMRVGDMTWVMSFLYADGSLYDVYTFGRILLILRNNAEVGEFRMSADDEMGLDARLWNMFNTKPAETPTEPDYEQGTEPGTGRSGDIEGMETGESVERIPDYVIQVTPRLLLTDVSASLRGYNMITFDNIRGEYIANPALLDTRITTQAEWDQLLKACGADSGETAVLNEWRSQFPDSDFIFTRVTVSSGSIKPVAYDVTIGENGALAVWIKKYTPGVGTADMADYCVIVPVAKSTVVKSVDTIIFQVPVTGN